MTNQYKNETHLAGVLAKDPEIRYTTSGKAVANFTIVTKYEKFSEFHRIVAWEKLAEKIGNLHQGDWLRIVGRLATRSWADKATGQKRYVTEVVAFQLVITSEEPVPLQPDTVAGGGTHAARAILSPSSKTKNALGLEVSDNDRF